MWNSIIFYVNIVHKLPKEVNIIESQQQQQRSKVWRSLVRAEQFLQSMRNRLFTINDGVSSRGACICTKKNLYKCAWGGENSKKYIFSQHFLSIRHRKQWKYVYCTRVFICMWTGFLYTLYGACQCGKIFQIYVI